jgi:hypothetical protein
MKKCVQKKPVAFVPLVAPRASCMVVCRLCGVVVPFAASVRMCHDSGGSMTLCRGCLPVACGFLGIPPPSLGNVTI